MRLLYLLTKRGMGGPMAKSDILLKTPFMIHNKNYTLTCTGMTIYHIYDVTLSLFFESLILEFHLKHVKMCLVMKRRLPMI